MAQQFLELEGHQDVLFHSHFRIFWIAGGYGCDIST